jgi:hypothetical protein
MISFAQLARIMYAAYNLQAGGKTYDGKDLPTWKELGADRQACWLAAAKAAVLEMQAIH